jgi:hypothetical protein
MNLFALAAILIGLGIAAAVAVRAIGGNIAVVDDWRVAWRYYSTWGWLFVAMLPDLWNSLLAGGYLDAGDVPSEFSWSVKIALAGTFILKQIKQVERPAPPEFKGGKG